jgi:myo-inositol-1(or 4)-monophosphatase
LQAREDLALIEEAVREAGKIARSYFGGSYKKWDKGKGDPVTEADLAIDKYLRETFTTARPPTICGDFRPSTLSWSIRSMGRSHS